MTDDNAGQQPPQYPGEQPQPNWGNAYPPPPGQQPPGYHQPPPGYQPYYGQQKHPQAVLALVLGILGVTVCSFTAPFAWWIGGKAVKEIDASQGAQSGRGEAMAGKVMGIIGTVLLALSILVIVVIVIVAVSNPDAFDESSTRLLRVAG